MNKSLSISLFGIPKKTIFLFFTTLTLLLYGACSSNVSTEIPEEEQPPAPTPQTYTVTFNTNGGSEVQSREVNSSDTVAKPDDPIRRGYRFLNWYSDPDAPSTAYDFGTAVRANITLYANWIKKFDVKFITNTGSGVTRAGGNENNNIETIPVDSNATISVPSQVPTRDGYRFLNWYSDLKDPSTAYDFGTKVTTNVTLYANWLKTFTVTFNMNGGTAVASQTIDSGKVVAKPTNPTNEKHGGTFEAWYSNEELTADSEYGNDDFDDPVIKNLSLYAKWSYMVTYNATTGAITGLNLDLPAGDVRLVIPSNVNGVMMDSIRHGAFDSNTRIVSLGIAEGIKYIGACAFATLEELVGVDGQLGLIFLSFPFRESDGTEIESRIAGNLVIPNSVETIGEHAFAGCDGFTGGLAIPNSVKTIGVAAFADCTGFNGRLTISDSVKTIREGAFWNCRFTGSLTIPKFVKTIEYGAFSTCTKFTGSLTIPNSVDTIGDFAFEAMTEIDNFVFENSTPPRSIGTNIFENITLAELDIRVPSSAVATYQRVTNLAQYRDRIRAAE